MNTELSTYFSEPPNSVSTPNPPISMTLNKTTTYVVKRFKQILATTDPDEQLCNYFDIKNIVNCSC